VYLFLLVSHRDRWIAPIGYHHHTMASRRGCGVRLQAELVFCGGEEHPLRAIPEAHPYLPPASRSDVGGHVTDSKFKGWTKCGQYRSGAGLILQHEVDDEPVGTAAS